MDVNTAFLDGELEEETYIEQHEGSVVVGQENKVCESLYRLKQSSKVVALDIDN
ncbi:unnamed protein product [Rhodiola kirilowii]